MTNMKIIYWQLVSVALAMMFGQGVSINGSVTILTTPGSEYDYHTSLSDPSTVSQQSKPESDFHISRNLHDGQTVIVIGNNKYKRTLILTDNTVEVYKDNISDNRSVWVQSLGLRVPPECAPWYILLSSYEPSEKFYIKYRPNCIYGYTEFLYEEGDFSPAINQPTQGILLTTKEQQELIVSIEEDGHKLRVRPLSVGSSNLISTSAIADCSVLRTVYPLDPLHEGTVSFAIDCETTEGTTKLYHTLHTYTQYETHIVTNKLDPGIPKGHGQVVAVIGTDGMLTMYNALNLERGVPGRRCFVGGIERAHFTDDGWLVLQVENSNVFGVNIDLFISSRGGDGAFELDDTNIGQCDPTCPPVIAFQDYLGVFTKDTRNRYTLAIFNLTTGTPQAVERVPDIPERPFAAIYIQDPNPIPKVDTTTTTEEISPPLAPNITEPVPEIGVETNTLTKALSFTGSGLVLILIVATTIGLIAWFRKQRQYSLTRCTGSESELGARVPHNAESPGTQERETRFTNRPETLDLTRENAEDMDNTCEQHATPTTPLLQEPIPEENQPVIRAEEGTHSDQQVTQEGNQATHTFVMPPNPTHCTRP